MSFETIDSAAVLSASTVLALRQRACNEKLRASLPKGIAYRDILMEQVRGFNAAQLQEWLQMCEDDRAGGAEVALVYCAMLRKQNIAKRRAEQGEKTAGNKPENETEEERASARVLTDRRRLMMIQMAQLCGATLKSC